jgi:DNA modification methylase
MKSQKKAPAKTKLTGPKTKTVPYNDIDLSRWKDYDDIYTDSLWLINSRDRTNGHKLEYHGNYIPQIAAQTFSRYSKPGDVIIDLFLGSGTSAIEAMNLERCCIGVELKPELADYVQEKIPTKSRKTIKIINGDSAHQSIKKSVFAKLRAMEKDYGQLLVLHPPYQDIIKFSDLPSDLSNAASTEEFLTMFRQVATNGFDLLEPGRFAVLIIGDKYAQGELVPLGFLCMQEMNKVGFVTKSIVVKNIEGNEKGKGRTNNLWRYRALAGGFYIFKHEYVIILQKPAKAKRKTTAVLM